MGALKLIAGVALISFTALYVLPMTIRLAFGEYLPPSTFMVLAFLIGLPTLGFIAVEMWKNIIENRDIRTAKRKMEAISEQSYGCIQPQVLNSFVVFPVRVNKRGCEASSWVEMGEEAMVVNLCSAMKISGGVDTEGPLQRLCEVTFKQELEVIIFCGGGTAGPTGLAVGVGRKDFGPYLASRVAQSIQEAMRMGIRSK